MSILKLFERSYPAPFRMAKHIGSQNKTGTNLIDAFEKIWYGRTICDISMRKVI